LQGSRLDPELERNKQPSIETMLDKDDTRLLETTCTADDEDEAFNLMQP
jgi:hypothetical protein